MAYFGLDAAAPSFPGGLVVEGGDPRAATRLKEVVQGLKEAVTLAKQEAGIKAGKARPPQDPAQEVGFARVFGTEAVCVWTCGEGQEGRGGDGRQDDS